MPSIDGKLAWNQAVLDNGELLKQLHQVSIALFTVDQSRFLQLIGSASILAASGRDALAITARHNFDQIQKVQQPPDRSHHSTPAIFRTTFAPLNLSPKYVRAMYFDGDEYVDGCVVTSCIALSELDIALFTVRFQDSYRGPEFRFHFDIDSRPLQVGEEVASLAFDGLEVIRQGAIGESGWTATMAHKIDVRRGRITRSYVQGGRSPWPAAESTIPIVGGMSGGAVFRLKENGVPETGICAILSKDISPSEAFSSFEIGGHSTLAMIYPALVTAVPIKFPGWASESFPTVLDLVRAGVLNDLGNFDALFDMRRSGQTVTIQMREPLRSN